MPIRIQRKRTRGWKMPPNTVSVCRPGKWGNPARIGMWKNFNAADAVRAFEGWLYRDPTYRSWENIHGKPPTCEEIKTELGGKNLACFCAIGQPCHADILLKIANPTPGTRMTKTSADKAEGSNSLDEGK